MTMPNGEQPGPVREIVEQLTAQGFASPEQPGDQWAFLLDPGWQPDDQDSGVPLDAVVGGWLVSDGGTLSRFHPNAGYEPSAPGSPTDPVDAVLQLLTRGDSTSEMLFSVMKDASFSVALDEQGLPLVAPSPDDVPSLLVTTAPVHRGRVKTGHWREVTSLELAGLLEERGVDLMINPGAPSSIRLLADVFVRHAAGS
jgi:hypothetical protein